MTESKQDVELIPDSNGIFDLSIVDNQLGSVEGLQTSIEVSLFTDARAPESIVPDAKNRRGWVGNIKTAIDDRSIGGTLWLLDQARLTASTISQAEIYARESLLHFLQDSVASSIDIEIIRANRRIDIGIDIKISNNITERYNVLWRLTNAAGISNV